MKAPTAFYIENLYLKSLPSFTVIVLACLTLLSQACYAEQISQPNSTSKQKTSGDLSEYQSRFKQTHLSCAVISSEHLTALQLYQRGLPRKLAIESLPSISREGKKRLDYVYQLATRIGVLNAYADINTNFSRCSTLVHQYRGRPAPDLAEHAYYYCSGENKLRYEIILYIDKGLSQEELKQTIPESHHSVLRNYHRLIRRKGTLAAFDLTANNLKACIAQIE